MPAPLGDAYRPDPAQHARYRKARTAHLAVEAALSPLQEEDRVE